MLFEAPQAWEKWLVSESTASGVWLKIAKKASGKTSVSYAEALDVALCYGWIDGQKLSYDEQYFLQKFTPRRTKSLWSKRNVAKVDELIKSGKMQTAGLAEIEAAKQDGRWGRAYESSRNMAVPADFQRALDRSPAAKAFFQSLNKTNSYAFLWQVETARPRRARRGLKSLSTYFQGEKNFGKLLP